MVLALRVVLGALMSGSLAFVACGGDGMEGAVADGGLDARRDAKHVVVAPIEVDVDQGCPKTLAEAESAQRLCMSGLSCGYGQVLCSCEAPCGAKQNTGKWTCRGPRVDGCPESPPVAGGKCAVGKVCNYGGCCTQPFECPAGTWIAGPQQC